MITLKIVVVVVVVVVVLVVEIAVVVVVTAVVVLVAVAAAAAVVVVAVIVAAQAVVGVVVVVVVVVVRTAKTHPDKLNECYARFDRENTSTPVPLPCGNHDPPFVATEQETRRALTRLDVKKATEPDNIKPRLLKTCRNQLASIFTFIFNWSLVTSTMPLCFKQSTIIPVPKKPSPKTPNDYRPVALTSAIMKCFEKFVLSYLKSLLPPNFDVFQFAYRINRSIDNAIAFNTHEILTHLERK
ncbi:Non-LTR (Long terminal repeat) retrotransposon and domain-containing protein [Elysia marginata]|uniref:Non-LTR (Long terminal repeat) retrotransposon and domain-containing protein n=1 Tax=Elysia marginata TaxID=1093978 RepID=A0AAV4FEG4_9GAST|nr:Non-LTR (Long terminal repeat) retrotransposon and domain-containing protein [Elysia marginata]